MIKHPLSKLYVGSELCEYGSYQADLQSVHHGIAKNSGLRPKWMKALNSIWGQFTEIQSIQKSAMSNSPHYTIVNISPFSWFSSFLHVNRNELLY